jgi:hypothetical protein
LEGPVVPDVWRIATVSSGRTGAGEAPSPSAGSGEVDPGATEDAAPIADCPDKIRRGDIAFQRFDGRHEARLDHQQFRRGVAQDVAELDAAQRGVDRHRHGAHPGAAEIDFQKFRPVRAHQRDTVAGLNPGAQQAARGCGCDRSRLGIAPSCFAEDEQGAVAILRGLPRQNCREDPVRRREALSRLRPDRPTRPLPGRAAITCLHPRLLSFRRADLR